jgi:hypothetical protein
MLTICRAAAMNLNGDIEAHQNLSENIITHYDRVIVLHTVNILGA